MNASPCFRLTAPGRQASPAWFNDPTTMRRRVRMGILGLSMLALAACGKNGPDLEAQFTADMPDMWQVVSFKIDAEEDVGSEVEPRRRFRFRAEVAPKNDLYQSLGILEGRAILKLSVEKGDEAPVLGTASSAFHADKWKSVFSLEQAPDFFAGRPADSFGTQHVVMGSSDYKSLITAAKAELVKRAEQTAADEAKWQTMDAERNALNQKVQADNRQLMEGLNREQQRIHEEQTVLRNQARQESDVVEKELQAIWKEKGAEPRQALDTRVGALDTDYRLKVAELQAQGKEQRQSLAEQRKQLRIAHNEDMSATRKRLSAADFTRYRASADEALRNRLAELDNASSERQAQLREQETALSSQRREQITQANTTYKEKAAAIREELDALRSNRNDSINQKANEAINALNAELQSRRQEYQNTVKTNSEQVAAKRQQADQFAGKMQQNRREDVRREQFIVQLEAAEN